MSTLFTRQGRSGSIATGDTQVVSDGADASGPAGTRGPEACASRATTSTKKSATARSTLTEHTGTSGLPPFE